jgi:alpha-D-ribose 1-methylphosphonate 5-triphosphate synthase subunit PhnG
MKNSLMEGMSKEEQRQRWMSALAQAPIDVLEFVWREMEGTISYRFVEKPAVSTVTVRVRGVGAGWGLALGEMRVSRCSVQLPQGTIGHGYVAGRDLRHAELAAVFDALLQDPSRRPVLETRLIAPMLRAAGSSVAGGDPWEAATRAQPFTVTCGEPERPSSSPG